MNVHVIWLIRCVVFSLVDICQLWNLSFISIITSKPFQVIISWNVTTACQEHNFTFEMIGPKQNLTKRLQKNTTFLVIKDVDLDTTYEVFLYDQGKELASGKFRSAARGKGFNECKWYKEIWNSNAP